MSTRAARRRNVEQTSKATLTALLSMLRVPRLYPHQLEMIVQSGIHGRDVFAQVAPGDGKTLGFAGAFLTRCQKEGGGVGILIEPLLALLYQLEQVLSDLGIEVIVLGSETRDRVCTILSNTVKPVHPIVIVARPSEILHPAVMRSLKLTIVGTIDHETNFPTSPVVLFCVDEAHCVAFWSYNFLPEWGKLHLVTDQLEANVGQRCPLMLLTGTATLDARKKAMEKVGFNRDSGVIILQSPRKLNIQWMYHAGQNTDGGEEKTRKTACLMEAVVAGHVVIVYCNTPKQCETRKVEWNKKLVGVRIGLQADAYHGELSQYKRKILSQEFAQAARRCAIDRAKRLSVEGGTDKRKVIIFCTTALSMGVDIPGVERVIIWNMSRNSSEDIQKGLRAGRAPQSKGIVHVFMCWKEYLQHVKYARVTGRRAIATGEQKGNDNETNATVLLRFATTMEEQATSVWQVALTLECRDKLHEKHFGTSVGNDCGQCDYCIGMASGTKNDVPDFEDLDNKIRVYFNDYSNQSVAFDVARRAIKALLTTSKTHAVVAVRIRYFIIFLGELKLVLLVNGNFGLQQGPNFTPIVVAPIVVAPIVVAPSVVAPSVADPLVSDSEEELINLFTSNF